jgi:hypothetical protein
MDGAGHLLLSFDVTVGLPKAGGGTLTVKPADVVSFDGVGFSLVFDSAEAGIPDGMNLEGASMLPNADLLMSFDEPGSIAGLISRRKRCWSSIPAQTVGRLLSTRSSLTTGRTAA